MTGKPRQNVIANIFFSAMKIIDNVIYTYCLFYCIVESSLSHLDKVKVQ